MSDNFGVEGFPILRRFKEWLGDISTYSLTSAPAVEGFLEDKTLLMTLSPPFAGSVYGQYTVSPIHRKGGSVILGNTGPAEVTPAGVWLGG